MSEYPADPGSGTPDDALEAEGIPDLTDRSAAGPDDPERSPDLGADAPIAVDDFGTTAAEEEQGEPLDDRLDREEPDVGESGAPHRSEPDLAGRLVAEDDGVRPDSITDVVADDATDVVADDAVEDAGGFTPEEQAVHTLGDTAADDTL